MTARDATDKQLNIMEKRLSQIYLRSYKDISADWDKYMKSHAPKVDSAYKELVEATKSGDKDRIAKAREVYEHTVKNVTVNNKRFRDMRDETCAKLSNLNETAVNYVNGNMPKIYTVNYNAFGDETIAGYSFSLVNENAVKNLIDTGNLDLYKHVNVSKDIAWNEKFINSQVTQSIIQGESIPEMSKRIFPELMRKSGNLPDAGIMKRNLTSAIRIARTMTTAAENKGRQDSFVKATNDGVILKRRWVATHDERTRAWHSDLDGVEVDVNEPWENDYGEIMFPGDPTADAANVYNCRCSIRSVFKGFKWNKSSKTETVTETKTEYTQVEQTTLDFSLPTLHNYQATYDAFKAKRAAEITDLTSFKEMDTLLTELIDNNEFRMRIPIDDDGAVLTSILKDGRFKTQFETGTSGGAYAPQKRIQASEHLFGNDGSMAASEFEKYGYLGSKDVVHDDNIQLLFYGEGKITFKKDKMMNRTTFTIGDSLRDAEGDGKTARFIMGSSVANPDSTVAIGRPSLIDDFLHRTNQGIEKYGIEGASGIGNKVRSYFELQYHGDLTLDDIESMTVDKNILDEVFKNEDLLQKVKDKNIKLHYIYNGELMDYNIP